MTTREITMEIESEAAIYADGSPLTKADILRAYRRHLSGATEPLDIQRFCEQRLALGDLPASRIAAFRDDAAAHGDAAMAAVCDAAINGDAVAMALVRKRLREATACADD